MRSTAMKPQGYRVERQYRITLPASLESLDKVLAVADAAMSQGARPVTVIDAGPYETTQPSLMQFSVKDPEKLTRQAMDSALLQARKLAERAAQEMGYAAVAVTLLAVRSSDAGADREQMAQAPATLPSRQPIVAVVSIEVEYGLNLWAAK